MTRTALLAFAVSAFALSAVAQEPISTRSTQDAPPAVTQAAPTLDQPTQSQIDAAKWGHDVLARANGQLPPSSDKPGLEKTADANKGCERNPDRAVHGSGGVAVGSGGYRHTDIYAQKPVGDCGSVAVGVSITKGGYGRYGRYR